MKGLLVWHPHHSLSSYIGRGAFELDDAHGGVKCCPCCDDSTLSLVAALGGEDDPPWCVGDLILFLTDDHLYRPFAWNTCQIACRK
jgi:hypothetical protein